MALGLLKDQSVPTPMIGRSLLIFLAFISLSACSYPGAYSTSHDVKFSKRGITLQQLDADWSACRKENTVAMSFAEAYTEAKRATSFAEEYLRHIFQLAWNLRKLSTGGILAPRAACRLGDRSFENLT